MMARITSKTDPAYSKRCLEATKKRYDWGLTLANDTTTANAGAALQAAIEMYRITGLQAVRWKMLPAGPRALSEAHLQAPINGIVEHAT